MTHERYRFLVQTLRWAGYSLSHSHVQEATFCQFPGPDGWPLPSGLMTLFYVLNLSRTESHRKVMCQTTGMSNSILMVCVIHV
jgi:hypothetical protein